MSLFTEVFSTAPEKSRLIIVLVTGSFAFLIFVLNQISIRQKERRELKTKKIEELYLAAIKYTDNCELLVEKAQHTISKRRENLRESGMRSMELEQLTLETKKVVSDLRDSIFKIEMLLELYFSDYSEKSYYPIKKGTFELSQIFKICQIKTIATVQEKGEIFAFTGEARMKEFCSQVAKSTNSQQSGFKFSMNTKMIIAIILCFFILA
jgi:hypothetical protein